MAHVGVVDGGFFAAHVVVHDGDIAFAVDDAGGVAGGVVLVGGDVTFGVLGVEDVFLGVAQYAVTLAEGVGGGQGVVAAIQGFAEELSGDDHHRRSVAPPQRNEGSMTISTGAETVSSNPFALCLSHKDNAIYSLWLPRRSARLKTR